MSPFSSTSPLYHQRKTAETSLQPSINGMTYLMDLLQSQANPISGSNASSTTLLSTMTRAETSKSVSFCEQVRTVRIRNNVDMLVNGGKHVLWYSRGELRLMVREARNVIRRFENGSERPSDLLRGLERGTDSGFARSRRIKRIAYNAFFQEQERQKKLGTLDMNELRNVYVSITRKFTQEAIDVALMDYMILREEDDDNDRSDAAMSAEENTCWLFSPPKWLHRQPSPSCRPLSSYHPARASSMWQISGKRIDQNHPRTLLEMFV